MPINCSTFASMVNNGAVSVQVGGKILGAISHVGFGGFWVKQWTPSQPSSADPDPTGPIRLNVTDNAYLDIWIPFSSVRVTGNAGGGEAQTPELPRGHLGLEGILQIMSLIDANRESERRLQNPKCASLFDSLTLSQMDPIEIAEMEIYGEALNIGLQTLRNTRYRILSLGAPRVERKGLVTTISATGAATMSSNEVWINSQGFFFNSRPNIPGMGTVILDAGTALNQNAIASLVRLHELGHQVGLFGHDAQDSVLNRRYTQAVIDACFPDARNHR